MSLSAAARKVEIGERYRKALYDAQAIAKEPNHDREAYLRAVKAIEPIQRELEDASAAERMESAQADLERFDASSKSAQERLADGDRSKIVELGSVRAQRRAEKKYQERYGLSRDAHADAFSEYIGCKAATTEQLIRKVTKVASESMGDKNLKEEYIHKIFDDSLGGFTVSDDWQSQLIRRLPGFMVARRSGITVRNTSKPIMTFPVVNAATSFDRQYSSDMNQGFGNWVAEANTQDGTAYPIQSKPTFGTEEIPVHNWRPNAVEITPELADDTDVDLEGLLLDLASETYGMDWDLAFFRGTGNGHPEGLLSGGSATVNVASAATYGTPILTAPGNGTTPATRDNGFTYQRIIDLYIALAAQYREHAVWYMSSDTYGRLLQLYGSDGHPLFPINSTPGTLLNKPIYFSEFVANGSTLGNVPIFFGDPRFYVMAERKQMMVRRLVERYAPNVALMFMARSGGQLTVPEAFRLGVTAA